ncbi:MAG: hypothetical protein ACRD2L_15075, partial [Terriglobia bacterium]
MSNKSIYIRCISCLFAVFLASGIALGGAEGAKDAKSESKDVGKEAERALSAANVLFEITKTPEKGIPQDLLNHAD